MTDHDARLVKLEERIQKIRQQVDVLERFIKGDVELGQATIAELDWQEKGQGE